MEISPQAKMPISHYFIEAVDRTGNHWKRAAVKLLISGSKVRALVRPPSKHMK
jgi:hypothetical protein